MAFNTKSIDMIRRGYASCCDDDQFFEMFYSNFLSQSDEIAVLFKNTDWPHQIQLIRKALHSAIIFAQSHEISSAKKHMEAIAYSHSREYMNIKPEYYPMWLEAMLRTLREYDPYLSPELEAVWREVLTFSIDFMISKYDAAP